MIDLQKISLKVKQQLEFRLPAQVELLLEINQYMSDEVPIIKALDSIIETMEVENKTKHFSYKVVRELKQSVMAGKGLGYACNERFDPTLAAIINAGEKAGNIEDSLKQVEKDAKTRSAAISAMSKPLFMAFMYLAVSFVVIFMFAYSLLPQLSMEKPFEEWPESAQFIVTYADFLQVSLPISIVGLFTAFYLTLNYWRNSYSPNRLKTDGRYPNKIYCDLTYGSVVSTLANLLSADIKVTEALEVMERSANPYVGYHLATMRAKFESGGYTMSEALATGLIDKQTIISIKSRTDVMEHESKVIGLRKAGEIASQRTIKAAKRLGIFLGLVFGFIAASNIVMSAISMIDINVSNL